MIGGNAGYFLALAVWRMFLQKLKARNIGVSLLMGVLTGGIIMLTIRKEMRILGIISGDYGDLSWWGRTVVGIIYCLISLVFIPCYQFVVFKLKLYPGRKDGYTAYVYHDFFFLFSTGIWCVLALNAMLVAAVLSGGYKTSWDGACGIIQMFCYMAGMVLMLLRQKTFVRTEDSYSYRDFGRSIKGKLKDIRFVEEIRGGVVLHTDSTSMRIRCSQKPYIDLLRDRLSDIGSQE